MVARAQALVSGHLGGNTMGKDRVLRLWLSDADPAVEFLAQPIFKWASATWMATGRPERLANAWRHAALRVAAARGKGASQWRDIRGPASTLWATLHNIQWTWPAPHTLLDGHGTLYDMRMEAPVAVREAATLALEAHTLDAWALRRQIPGIDRPFLEPARALLRQKRGGSAGQWKSAARPS